MKLLRRKNKKNKDTEQDMGFFDHLEELRKRIFMACFGILGGCIVAAIFIDDIIKQFLLQPAGSAELQLQNLRPFGQPFLYFKVILIVGVIIAFPFILYQLWRFIMPGLFPRERRWARQITFFTSLCFFTGVVFSYFVMIPSMLAFAASFGTEQIKNVIDVNEYVSFITTMLLATGLTFEMPMVVWVLSRFGLMSPKFMSKYRRHAIIVILIIAAIVTPTPDPVSQMIFATPLLILYELSIFISRGAYKKREEKIAEETEESEESEE